MSNLNTDNVTVSLSRLALAKAIKTPDEGETEAEPWTKSVIFHQSHVSDSMRQSMLFPNQPRGRQHQQQHHRQSRHLQEQQGRPTGARRRSRSSGQLLDQYQYQQQQQQQQHQQAYQQQHGYQHHNQTQQQYHSQQHQEPITTTNNIATTTTTTSTHPQQRSNRQSDILMRPSSQERNRGVTETSAVGGGGGAAAGTRRHIMASDDEDEEDDDEDQESSEDDDEDGGKSNAAPMLPPVTTSSSPILAPAQPPAPQESTMPVPTPMPRKSASLQPLNNKQQRLSQHIPEPSDDESDQVDEDADSSSDDDSSQDAAASRQKPASDNAAEDMMMNARRMSTLRQLERGPSVHKRSRSYGDLNLMQEQAVAAETAAAVGIGGAVAHNPYADVDVTLEPTGKSGAIERWRQDISGDAFGSRPSSSQSFDEDSSAGAYQRRRRSTMGEMDMMYYHMQQQQQFQQQQQQMQWQMQQQQAAQMAQIQQYQQAAMMSQPTLVATPPPPPPPMAGQSAAARNPNRKSVSAMDVLTQIEREKAESPLKPKPKPKLNPTHADLGVGLLGRMPAKNTHSMSFQQMQQSGDLSKLMMRASRSDMNLSSPQYRRSRSPGPEKALGGGGGKGNINNGGRGGRMTSTDVRRRSEMIRSESAPHVTPSMSTPTSNRQSTMMPSSQSMYGQYLMPMAATPMMVPTNQMMQPPQFPPGGRPASAMMSNASGQWPAAGNNNWSSGASSGYR